MAGTGGGGQSAQRLRQDTFARSVCRGTTYEFATYSARTGTGRSDPTAPGPEAAHDPAGCGASATWDRARKPGSAVSGKPTVPRSRAERPTDLGLSPRNRVPISRVPARRPTSVTLRYHRGSSRVRIQKHVLSGFYRPESVLFVRVPNRRPRRDFERDARSWSCGTGTTVGARATGTTYPRGFVPACRVNSGSLSRPRLVASSRNRSPSLPSVNWSTIFHDSRSSFSQLRSLTRSFCSLRSHFFVAVDRTLPL
ncbi:hypothetical protein VT84_34970 [Gemmata sp. SH-PL17]|nr:hypothetical protein VT84_34970 [Gemmata sp. SH-PL17]